MTRGRKRSAELLMIVAAASLFLVASVPVSAQTFGEAYSYSMMFDRDGFTTVDILYNSGVVGSGVSWVAAPKNFTETNLTILEGTIISMGRATYRTSGDARAHPFYDNLTFSYLSESEPFSMRISYNMTYGAMIVEPNGFFYSPQIGVPSSAKVEVNLTLPDGVEVLSDAQPPPTRVYEIGSRLTLIFNPSSESRIAVTFRVPWAKQTSHIRQGIVEADVPSRYLDLGTRMVALYENAVPFMNNFFNQTIDRVSMKFFIPLSLPQLGIGGYTPIDPSSFQTGTIFLNLFYFRALPGTMETIAIHELTHQYEARVGISSSLLWVHEGLANYVAVQMASQLGYDATSTDEELDAAARELNENYGMVQYWGSGAAVASLFEYYAASYEVFKSLGQQYGNLSLYSRFFQGLRELKDGLRSSNVAVYQLSLAAGTDLVPQFSKWGFELVDLSGISARIAKLRAEAQWYGPLLPFREQALEHLGLAEQSMYTEPETAMGHITIAAFYIETVPMIIAGIVLFVILIGVVVVLVSRRIRRKPVTFDHPSVP